MRWTRKGEMAKLARSNDGDQDCPPGVVSCVAGFDCAAWVENGRSTNEAALETYAIYQAKGWPTSYGRGTLTPKPWVIG